MNTLTKTKAIEILGGTTKSAALAIGCTVQAVNKWPVVLSARISDRVIAAQIRLKSHASAKRKPKAPKQ